MKKKSFYKLNKTEKNKHLIRIERVKREKKKNGSERIGNKKLSGQVMPRNQSHTEKQLFYLGFVASALLFNTEILKR